MGRINIIKLIIYQDADNTGVWGRNIQNDKGGVGVGGGGDIWERSASKFNRFQSYFNG